MNPFIDPDDIPYAGRMQIGYDEQRYQAWIRGKIREQRRVILWQRLLFIRDIILILVVVCLLVVVFACYISAIMTLPSQ